MNIVHEKFNDVDIIKLGGEIVMANSAEVRHGIHNIIENGKGFILIDLSKVNFIDSSGLAVLVSVYKAARVKHGMVALFNLTNDVRSLIELTRLHQVFEIYDDCEYALSVLNNYGNPTNNELSLSAV